MSDLLKWNRGSRITIANNTQVTIKDNIINASAIMHISSSILDILGNVHVVFEGNVGFQCGGLLLENSTINFYHGKSILWFSQNKGSRGGAMAFYATSQIKIICSAIEMYYISNHAQRVGGAMYVHDFGSLHLVPNGAGYKYKPMLAQQVVSNCKSQLDLLFINNTAQLAGSALYGGWVDSKLAYYTFGKPFSQLNNSGDDLSVVSSDPVRVCPCKKQTPNCNITVQRD